MAIQSPTQNPVLEKTLSKRIVYLCKLTQSLVWEEVPEMAFNDRKYALADNSDLPRYTEDYAIYNYDTREITISSNKMNPEALAILLRRFSVNPPTGSIEGGYIREPKHIHFKTSRSGYLLELPSGRKYKRI